MRCRCGEEEIEAHVLLECGEFAAQRGDLREWWRAEMPDRDIMRGAKGMLDLPLEIDKVLLRRIGEVWRAYEKREREGGM